jgi:anaerobic ribonucleoside-triphosphate reductase
MEKPLGMKGEKDKDVIKKIVLMGVVTDEEGFVYFNELLFKAMRSEYGETHVKNRILVDHEIKAREKIESIKLKLKQKSWKE